MALQFVGAKAVAFAGTTSDTAISLTDLAGGLASAPAAGDLVIVAYGVSATADETIGVTTSGYTERQELYANSSRDANLSVSWKFMGGTPDTSVSVSGTGNASNAGGVAIHVWRSADTSNPFDVADTTASGINSDQVNPPSITPSTSGAVVIACGCGATTGTADMETSDLSNFVAATGIDTNNLKIGMGSIAWTSGSVDPAQFGQTASNSGRSWVAVSMALRPQTATHYTLTAEAGSFSLGGAAATLRAARRLSASVGSFAVTGANANLLRPVHYVLTAEAGSFTLTGSAAALRAARRLLAGTLPVYVGVGSAVSGVGDISIPVPAGIASGDLLLTAVETANEAVATPAGWLEHPESPVANSSGTRLTVFYRFSDGTETNVAIADPGDHALGAMIAYRHVDPVTPFHDTNTSTTQAIAAVTVGSWGLPVVALYATSIGSSTFSNFSWDTIPSASETNRLIANTTEGNDGSLGIWTAEFRGASSETSTGLFNLSGTGTPTVAGMHFSLNGTDTVGSFTVTGSAATLRRGYKLTANAGTFTLSGSTSTLRAARRLTAEAGSFIVTGADAAIRKGFTLVAEAGEFIVSGAAATSRRTYVMAAEAASIALSGASATLRVARKLLADAGSFFVSGAEAEFDAVQRELTEDPTTIRVLCVEGEDRTIVVPGQRERVFVCSACRPRVVVVSTTSPRVIVLNAGRSRTITLPPENRQILA